MFPLFLQLDHLRQYGKLMGSWRATTETSCGGLVWQKGDLFLFYHDMWNTWFVADTLVPQEPASSGQDPWEHATCYARISGITYQGEPVPGGDVHLPWQSQKPAQGFRLMSKGNFIVEMVNELWDHYQREMQNSTELKDQICQQQQEMQKLQEQNVHEQQLHARELHQLKEQNAQQQQQYARELQQLQGQNVQQQQQYQHELQQLQGQLQGQNAQQQHQHELQQQQQVVEELKSQVAKQEEELTQLRHQKHTLERQLSLVQANTTAGMKGAPVA